MTDPRLILELFGDQQAQPVDLFGADELPELSWQQSMAAPQQTGDIKTRLMEALGAREPDKGGTVSDILSSRFDSGTGPSFGDYAQGVVQSATGKPSIAPGGDERMAEMLKTMAFVNTLSSQQSTSDFRNKQFDETARHNRASEDLMAQRLTRSGSGNKPIPATALKMQNEGLDVIGIAGGINADLGALIGQMDTGKLSLGMFENKWNQAKNYTGQSDEGSRNFDSFSRSLEKLRNDSLRLNKGVQTEGDATRAWNEIVANINDTDLVKERLKEVLVLNERAADLQKLNIDQIRTNYGHDPLDYSQYDQRPASVGAGQPVAASPSANGIKFLGFE